jgi:hypothetical protein
MFRAMATGAALLAASVAVGAWVLASEGPAGSASGKVVDRAGEPQAGAQIRFEDEDGARHDTISGSDGAFRLRLPAGSYRASAAAAGRSPALVHRDFVVGPGDPVRLVFALGATDSVTTVKASGQAAGEPEPAERLAAISVGGFPDALEPGAQVRGWAEIAAAEGDPVPFAKLRWKALAVGSGHTVPIAWGEAFTRSDGRAPVNFRVPGGANWAKAVRLRLSGRDDQGPAIGAAFQIALTPGPGMARARPGKSLGLQARLFGPRVARVGDVLDVRAEFRNDSPFKQRIDTTIGFGPAVIGIPAGAQGARHASFSLERGRTATVEVAASATEPGRALLLLSTRGSLQLAATASTDVLPAGREAGQAWAGEVDRAGAIAFSIPPAARPETVAFSLQVARSPRDAAVASLGPADGSIVSTAGGLLAASRLPRLGPDVVKVYVRRLSATRTAGGTWAWWPGLPPDPAVTPFVVRALAAARESGHAVPDPVWQEGVAAVLAAARGAGADPAALADAVWATGRAVPREVLDAALAERTRLGTAALARLADGLARLGDSRVLQVLAELDLAAKEEGGLVHWEDAPAESVARDWDRSAIEATAWALDAQLTAGSADGSAGTSVDDAAPRAARWLLRMRRGDDWGSARAGAVAARALLHPGLRFAPSGPIATTLDNAPVGLTPAQGALRLSLSGHQLKPGRHLLTLSQPASGAVFAATLKYHETGMPPGAKEHAALSIDRRYYALPVSRLARAGGKPLSELVAPGALDRQRPISAAVARDRLLIARVTVKARQTLRFVRVSDAVPGGAVPIASSRGGDHHVWTSPDGAEVRFDVPEMRPGTYEFVHAMRPRAAGTYLSPGPIAAAVHAPDIRARGAAVRLDLSR